ncbi:MAG: hypothetical protein ABH950_08990 [Candidatus Altiarchaeota archaeon]
MYVEVTIVHFTRGINKWDRNYTAAFRFEYTADLEKRIKSVSFHDEESKRSAVIPWTVLKGFLEDTSIVPYTNISGITLSKVADGLLLSDPHGLNITVHADQKSALRLTAKKVEGDLTADVRSLREKIIRI